MRTGLIHSRHKRRREERRAVPRERERLKEKKIGRLFVHPDIITQARMLVGASLSEPHIVVISITFSCPTSV